MSEKKYILVTGGAGYIGSHTTVELIQNGYNVVIVDNLVNSSYDAVARIEYIVKQPIPLHKVDIGDTEALLEVFSKYEVSGVIHFAALKAVGESTKIPLDYYFNNVRGTLSLLTVMKKQNVKTIVFSSSATVYGDATRFKDMIPIPEHCPTGATNPYGRTKLMIEQMLCDVQNADNLWRAAVLRYFNPIGAHGSGLIGEDPLGIPNNLLPFLAQVAVGRREKLAVFGNDYESHDGTPIRDYIHVVDLARGHISALRYLQDLPEDEGLYREWNLGTGKGSTVFDVYHAFCKAIGRELPYEVTGRRAGDVLNLTANPTRANTELRWMAELSIYQACTDLWKWTTENPYGFSSENYSWQLFDHENRFGYASRLHTISFPQTGFKVSIANYGALIQSIRKNGVEYTLGFDSLGEYMSEKNPYFGATIGRYANRISGACFEINGSKWEVDKNEDGNCLHGGKTGFDKQFFLGPIVKQAEKGGEVTLEFVYVDTDGQNGFPSDFETRIKYTIDEESVEVEYQAVVPQSSKTDITPVNLTNHSYFHLGEYAIDGLFVRSTTNQGLEVDEKKLPTGNIVEVSGDLVAGKTLARSDIYDHCFVADSEGQLDTRKNEFKQIFEVSDKKGRRIKIFSTEPAFQFYTGDGVDVDGFHPRSGLCIEPGRFTNAINVSEWRSQVLLNKDSVYGSRKKYVFS